MKEVIDPLLWLLMTIASLLPIAGAAGVTFAAATRGAVDGLASFTDFLRGDEERKAADEAAGPMMLDSLPSTLVDMENGGREALSTFHRLLQQKLAELGIDTSHPMTLEIDNLGNIRETSGHPQASEIEQVLETHEGISRYLRKAASQYELARAAREHAQFSEVYAKNPDLAVSQFSHLFDDRREQPRFSALLMADHAEPIFA